MKTILVTGSNGLLGQKIIYALRNRNDVECISTSTGANRMTAKDGYVYEMLDITNEKEIENIFSKYKPDVVINCAAIANVDACEKEPEKCMKLNVDAVSFLIRACEKFNTHLVHISTDFVFDGNAGPYKEEDKPNPVSVYGKSKYEAELLIQKSKIKWAIIRTILIYGVVDDQSRSNVVLWTKKSLENNQPMNAINDQYRTPTLSEDLADACISAALRGATGIYHVSGNEQMCVLDIVNATADFFHLDKSLIHPVSSEALKQPAKRPPVTGFIIDKAIRNLDFHPHTFLEGLEIVKQQLEKS